MACFVVDFQPIKQGCLCRIEAERFRLFNKPIASPWIFVWSGRLYLIAPALYFIGRFLFAVGIQPFRHLLIARAILDLCFEIRSLYPLESKKHVIKRTIEMIFTNVAGDQGATL